MRSEVIRIYKIVHTWTGILAGMALFIAFYAGALTMFKPELEEWASPPSAAASASIAEAPALLAHAFRTDPDAAKALRLSLAPAPVDRIAWRVSEPGADDHDELSVRHFTVTASGVTEVPRTHIGELIDVLHRVVGLPVDGDETRLFMGVIAALYGLAILSGLIILLPSLVKDLFAFRVGKNLKRMWLDAHNVVGLFSLPFHVVMAITATVFAFHDGIYAVQDRMIHDGKLAVAFQRSTPPNPKPRDPATMLPPAEIIAKVTTVAPEFEPTMLEYLQATGPRASVRVWGDDPRGLGFRPLGGFALVDPYSGKMISTDFLPGHGTKASSFLTAIFALHFGTYGGGLVKWGYFLLGLLGAWLFYSGNLLWIETRRKKAKKTDPSLPHQPRNTRLMASATVGICLGAVAGISVAIVSSKWLPGHVADPNAWTRALYYAVFFASIAWSFARGGSRALVDMLRVAAVATFAIPATSLGGALVPSLGPWMRHDAIGVDLTALVLGLVFLRIARAARKRAHDGPRDSVWAIDLRAPVSS